MPRRASRGISETMSVVLLVGITLALASSLFLMLDTEPSTSDIEIASTDASVSPDNEIAISHGGGETINTSRLAITLTIQHDYDTTRITDFPSATDSLDGANVTHTAGDPLLNTSTPASGALTNGSTHWKPGTPIILPLNDAIATPGTSFVVTVVDQADQSVVARHTVQIPLEQPDSDTAAPDPIPPPATEPDTTDSKLIGETDAVRVSQPTASTTHTVDFRHTYEDPVVVANVMTNDDPDPVHVRITDVTATDFTFTLEEWDYQDGVHNQEGITYMVVESGTYQLEGGGTIEADRRYTEWWYTDTQDFQHDWDQPPAIASTAYSPDRGNPVVTRHRNLDASSDTFQVALQEEEAYDYSAGTFGYIAMSRGAYSHTNLTYEGHHTDELDTYEEDSWYPFAESYDTSPVVVASPIGSSYPPYDTVTPRAPWIASGGTELWLQEEQSADDEMESGSATGRISWIVMTDDGDIYQQ